MRHILFQPNLGVSSRNSGPSPPGQQLSSFESPPLLQRVTQYVDSPYMYEITMETFQFEGIQSAAIYHRHRQSVKLACHHNIDCGPKVYI